MLAQGGGGKERAASSVWLGPGIPAANHTHLRRGKGECMAELFAVDCLPVSLGRTTLATPDGPYGQPLPATSADIRRARPVVQGAALRVMAQAMPSSAPPPPPPTDMHRLLQWMSPLRTGQCHVKRLCHLGHDRDSLGFLPSSFFLSFL